MTRGRRLVLVAGVAFAIACGKFGADTPEETPAADEPDAAVDQSAPPATTNDSGADAAEEAGVDAAPPLPAAATPLHITETLSWTTQTLSAPLTFATKAGNRLIAVIGSNIGDPDSVTVGGIDLDYVVAQSDPIAVSIWAVEVPVEGLNNNEIKIMLPSTDPNGTVAFARITEWNNLGDPQFQEGASGLVGPAVVPSMDLTGAGSFVVLSVGGGGKPLGPPQDGLPFFEFSDGKTNFIAATVTLVDNAPFEARWNQVQGTWSAVSAAFPRH